METKGLLKSAVGTVISAEVDFAGGWLWGTFKIMFLVTLSFLIYIYFWVNHEMASINWFFNFCVFMQPCLSHWWAWIVIPISVSIFTGMMIGGMVLQIGYWIVRSAVHKII